MNDVFDIVIAGGGPVGTALALGLKDSEYRIALLNPSPLVAATDARVIALSHGSRLILERLGVWAHLAAHVTAIDAICVSQRGGIGQVQISAGEVKVPALGYVVSYACLQLALNTAVAASDVEVMSGCRVEEVSADARAATVLTDTRAAMPTKLVAIADGGAARDIARTQTRDYRQCALVCTVATEQQHQKRAYERFTSDGPLALLPHQNRWSLVWTLPTERAQEIAGLNDVQFCSRLRTAFGAQLGAFHAPEQRGLFPLILRWAERPMLPRVVLIGNAAQTLHPVAGQGYNLGLRDAWELARTINASENEDPGDSKTLNEYFSHRRSDRSATILFTDTLIRLFCKDIPLLTGARGVGLIAMNAIPAVKNFMTRRMMFGVRG